MVHTLQYPLFQFDSMGIVIVMRVILSISLQVQPNSFHRVYNGMLILIFSIRFELTFDSFVIS